MKRMIAIAFGIAVFLSLALFVEGQRQKPTRAQSPKANQPQQSAQQAGRKRATPKALDRLKGAWEMTAQYTESGATLSERGLTFRTSHITVGPTKQVIEQVGGADPNAITFTWGNGDDKYSFTLKREVASKRYILSGKRGENSLVKNAALVYSEKEGFMAEGPPADPEAEKKFSPRITFNEEGGHTWFIASDFKITFAKPENP